MPDFSIKQMVYAHCQQMVISPTDSCSHSYKNLVLRQYGLFTVQHTTEHTNTMDESGIQKNTSILRVTSVARANEHPCSCKVSKTPRKMKTSLVLRALSPTLFTNKITALKTTINPVLRKQSPTPYTGKKISMEHVIDSKTDTVLHFLQLAELLYVDRTISPHHKG